jgi:hypothetical protein
MRQRREIGTRFPGKAVISQEPHVYSAIVRRAGRRRRGTIEHPLNVGRERPVAKAQNGPTPKVERFLRPETQPQAAVLQGPVTSLRGKPQAAVFKHEGAVKLTMLMDVLALVIEPVQVDMDHHLHFTLPHQSFAGISAQPAIVQVDLAEDWFCTC